MKNNANGPKQRQTSEEYLAEGIFDGFVSRSRIKKEIRVVNFVIDVNVKEN
jgi:acetyl-CoA carboxylase beta subunit